jgi:chemotaxis protein methyltransferase CheR
MSRLSDRIGHAAPRPAPTAEREDEMERFLEFFYRRTGMHFTAAKRYFVDRRVAERMAALGQSSLRGYLMHLRYDDAGGAELQALINAMTVNETDFYREEYQFRCLAQSLLPEIVARRAAAGEPASPLRIWSLPCSTGEEPYSIAMQLIEGWAGLAEHDVEIHGSDIDTTVLARARAGLYDERALHLLSSALRGRYFQATQEGQFRIDPSLREVVTFSQVNLSDAQQMRATVGRFDVIFCRNLLIYFDDAARRAAAASLFESLREGGFLCLGHSESMSRISSLFTVRKFADVIVYQKRSG